VMCATWRCEISSCRRLLTVLAVPAGMPAAGRCSGLLKLRAVVTRKRVVAAERSDEVRPGGTARRPSAYEQDREG